MVTLGSKPAKPAQKPSQAEKPVKQQEKQTKK